MLKNIRRSLTDLLGKDYMAAVQECAVKLRGLDAREAARLATESVDFLSEAARARQDDLLDRVGAQFIRPFANSNAGAPTLSFARASNLNAAPLGGFGIFRAGEDGRLYLAAKSEHYHTPLGHGFGGYGLIDWARALGIPNATHNNTRGYITRLMERELVRHANGLQEGGNGLAAVLESREPKVLNRVINLETGSLAVEAGIKMMLHRFYRLDGSAGDPPCAGRIPVFLVMADNDGGLQANYHGTTIFAQAMRGMWPELYRGCEHGGLFRVAGVRINDIADFEDKLRTYNKEPYRTAGFLHEIVLMNYGGILLRQEYLREAYRLCGQYGIPVLVDEIQSCMWYEGMFLYRLYGLRPDFVILGKGFPGGEYPASKILTTYEMDTLNQFGALVTNGQEELASLAYLVTMEFARENGEGIRRMGELFREMLQGFSARHPSLVERIEGLGHLAAVHFRTVAAASRFAGLLNDRCIDVSAQTYKANCPPAALLKLPWIASEKAMAFLVARMDEAAAAMEREETA